MKVAIILLFFLVGVSNADPECGAGNLWKCHADDTCIILSQLCDGRAQCSDGSDEFENPEDCPPCDGAFQCADGRCLAWDYVCNDYNNCGDMSDEPVNDPDACPSCPYAPPFFRCDNGRCVRESYVCNGRIDCSDGSDEFSDPDACPACGRGDFRCKNGRCINMWYQCDGKNDCGDNSDEWDDDTQGCPACYDYLFTCANGMCINTAYVCDGFPDCFDGSDETVEACPCADDEVRCIPPEGDDHPGECIPAEWVCDEEGIIDCASGSDEANCTHVNRVAGNKQVKHAVHHLPNGRKLNRRNGSKFSFDALKAEEKAKKGGKPKVKVPSWKKVFGKKRRH